MKRGENGDWGRAFDRYLYEAFLNCHLGHGPIWKVDQTDHACCLRCRHSPVTTGLVLVCYPICTEDTASQTRRQHFMVHSLMPLAQPAIWRRLLAKRRHGSSLYILCSQVPRTPPPDNPRPTIRSWIYCVRKTQHLLEKYTKKDYASSGYSISSGLTF